MNQHERLQELFGQALERPSDQREAFLAQACAGDAGLLNELTLLLAHDAADPEFLLPPEPPPKLDSGPTSWQPPESSANEFAGQDDPLIGQRLGQYEVKRVIGTGGMGTVYEAVQEQPHRSVALKVMKRELAFGHARRRFDLEIETLGRLRHPNIAQVYEAGTTDDDLGLPFFAMEYVAEARPLTRYADEQGLNTRARLQLFCLVCDAVQHGHQNGIIHRDLKPANILVDSAGQPKIIDFGVARATNADLSIATQHTCTGQLIGTVQYMSPEQCDGDPQKVDTRSDVYSLGVVLYELLTGSLPYKATGVGLLEATRQIRDAAPSRPSLVNRKLRGDAETIVLKALEKEPGKRYQSAADLRRDIDRYLAHEPIEARPPTAWTRAVRWAGAHPIIVTAAACAACGGAILGTFAFTTWFYYRRPDTVIVSSDGRKACLLSQASFELKRWTCPEAPGITFARLIDERAGATTPFVLLGSAVHSGLQYPGWLCAYDVRPGFGEPLWKQTISEEWAPEQVWKRKALSCDYGVFACHVADISDAPGQEIIAVHGSARSQCAIRVYDLAGNLLYQVWHEGALYAAYWIPEDRLLVLAGLYSGHYRKNSKSDNDGDYHFPVIFAIRPEQNLRSKGFVWPPGVEMPPVFERIAPVWYKWVCPPEIAGKVRPVLSVPLPGPSAGRKVHYEFTVAGSTRGAGWDMDEHGNAVEGTQTGGDTLTLFYRERPDLEQPHLSDHPPPLGDRQVPEWWDEEVPLSP